MVILENVDSIDSPSGDGDEGSESNLDLVLEHMRKLGYACEAVKMRANDYGLPQRRARYYLMAVKDVFAEDASSLIPRMCQRLQHLQREPKGVVWGSGE